jgi:hypothetical protein
MFCFYVQILCDISHCKKKWERYGDKHTYIGLYLKYPLFLSNFIEMWNFATDVHKTPEYQISWKSVTWKQSCSMRTDGRTDRYDEADCRYLQFCERT